MDTEKAYWKLHDELTIHQAMCLHFGIEPYDPDEAESYLWDFKSEKTIAGWDGLLTAIKAALKSKNIKGHVVLYPGRSPKEEFQSGDIDERRSTISVMSFRLWLQRKGVASNFFSITEEATKQPYLDSGHPRYSPKLAAVVTAWMSLEGVQLQGVSPKQALDKFLRENAVQFGLVKSDGRPNETGIEECKKIANWQPAGGAPKTPAKQPR